MSEHQNSNKTKTYLAAAGVFSFASFVMVTPVLFSLPVIALAALPVALHPNRKEIVNRIGNDLKSLWGDFEAHARQDLNRLGKWWDSKVVKQQPQEPVATRATEEPSTFKNASVKQEFGKQAEPGADATAPQKPEVKKAVPAAKPPKPNTP